MDPPRKAPNESRSQPGSAAGGSRRAHALKEGLFDARLLTLALRAARMGTWSWDPAEDVATHDALAREILDGVAEERTLDEAMQRHLRPSAFDEQARGLEQVLDPRNSEPRFEIELEWCRTNGQWSWIQMTGETVFSGKGALRHPVLMVGTVRDITQRRAVEARLAEANREKDRYLATLAHELRNPLGPLRYAAELLAGHVGDDQDWARQVLTRQVAHLTRLVDDLLDTSRIERGQLEVRSEPVDLGVIVSAAIDASRNDLKQHGQRIQVTSPPEPVIVDGDDVRLTQVVTNLLTNAAKFSRTGDTIEVTIERHGKHALLRVIDTGGGIAKEDLPHVFDLFYRSERAPHERIGGLGVGLYLVRRLIEFHRGTVEISSEGVGRGTTITVRLPARVDTTILPVAASRSHRPGSLRGRRVLIADDDPDSADTLAQLLRERGNEVFAAYAGDQAVEAAEREKPDVALLDLGMPGIDGLEACRRIRRAPWGRHLFMVALTGWGRPEDRQLSRDVGFDEFLLKPIDIAALEELLNRHGRLH